MVKKYTNEHDYYKPLRAFLTYHFGKTAGNETKLANVLHYCKTNWARISEHEIDGGDLDENVKTLLEIQPMDIARYFKYLAYGTETPAPGRAAVGPVACECPPWTRKRLCTLATKTPTENWATSTPKSGSFLKR